MSMRGIRNWMIALLLGAAITVHADTESHYQVDVPLESNSLASQEKAFHDGFQAVLKKNELSEPEGLKITNQQIMQTVSQFQVHDKDDKPILSIHFDKQAVLDLLDSLGVSVGQTKNKQWVAWIATSEGDKHRLLGGSPQPFELTLLSDLTHRINVDLIIPQLDLEDMEALSFDDIWLDNKAKWMKASDRYRADGVLVIKLFKNEGKKWHATWVLTTDKDDVKVEQDDSSLTSLFESGIDSIHQQLAAAAAAENTEAEEIYLEVADVHSSESYQSILSFIRTLRGVEQAELDGVTPDKVLYKLSVTVSRASLKRQISQSRLLIAEDKPEEKVLYYRLNT